MERLSFVLLFSFFSSISPAQIPTAKNSIQGIWTVDSAMFPDDIVKLRFRQDADSLTSHFDYELLGGGKVRMSMHSPPGRAICGNGIPVLKSGTWTVTNQTLHIALKGEYVAAGHFDFDLEYSIFQPDPAKLILKKTRTYKNEH